MKKEQAGFEDAPRMEPDDENEHEKHRRIKSEHERILRKQLCHLRPAEFDEIEAEAEAARPRRFKD